MQLSNDSYAMQSSWMHYIILLGVRINALVHLLILTQFARAYKASNISETVEDRTKATINGLV